ncbi:hypothetical protein NPX13_g7605 [Xylaria arbuscula]|uniref:SRR1-like domain-containing protein n=1 Tax=Xylaria arbuscula TaxID=114810 RepID=A0A9W8TK85_9PEZI|nr:hypothetical protein NPX13_g7605 [Xylaria arbuscula]
MSASNSSISANQPYYTHLMLYDIEAKLELDGDTIPLINAAGDTVVVKNLDKGGRRGASGLRPNAPRFGHAVAFQDERDLQRLEKRGKPELFLPVYNTMRVFRGPSLFADQAREAFRTTLEDFKGSLEASAIISLVKKELRGRNIDKVIAFGLGPIGIAHPSLPRYSLYEHAAVIVLAEAVRKVTSASSVTVMVQEPAYTDVCKEVLGEFGFEVIEGYGAKGFALVDDHSVVLTHHPSFPFRQIIADLARPALICMQKSVSKDEEERQRGKPLDLRADVDSVRSRKMLDEYHSTELPIPRQKAFWDNTWYVRNELMPLSGLSG